MKKRILSLLLALEHKISFQSRYELSTYKRLKAQNRLQISVQVFCW